MITRERLKKLLHYDPEMGIFTRKVTRTNTKAGDRVGCDNGFGYLRVYIEDRRYFVHKLAWLYVYGEWVEGYIDHIDLDKSNNRIANLRPATRSQNQANKRISSRNKTGFKGVHWSERYKRFIAQIEKNNKNKCLGHFKTAEEAHAAYCKAAEKIHGEFARAA